MACPRCGCNGQHSASLNEAGYDTFFEQQRRDRTWGFITFRLKDGDVLQVKMETSYRSVKDALQKKGSPVAAE